MSQPSTGLIGAQRQSRQNTFIDQHALIMAHNQSSNFFLYYNKF